MCFSISFSNSKSATHEARVFVIVWFCENKSREFCFFVSFSNLKYVTLRVRFCFSRFWAWTSRVQPKMGFWENIWFGMNEYKHTLSFWDLLCFYFIYIYDNLTTNSKDFLLLLKLHSLYRLVSLFFVLIFLLICLYVHFWLFVCVVICSLFKY